MDLWTFDVSLSEWRRYGTGTVSPDGKQVVPDINPATGRPFGLGRFAWHFPAPPPCTGRDCCKGPDCCKGGDPVALVSGAFFERQTDMTLAGRVPISITRLHQSGNNNPGPFGLGTLDINYGHRLQQEGTSLLYIIPSSRPFRFTPIAGRPNQFENTTDPSLRGSVLTRDITQEFSFTLRMKNGIAQRFDRVVGFANLAALSAIIDPNGNTITLTRSSPGPGRLGLLTEVRNPDGLTLRLDYDGNGRVTSITDPIGRRVTYTYDAAGYLATVTNPEGGVTRYNHDERGQMTEIITPRGIRSTQNEYDGQGRVRRQIQADGGVFSYDYTVVGGLVTETKVTDPRGGRTTYRFNCMSYPISITDANGQMTLFDRSIGTNRVNFTQDPLGRRTEFEYDPQGNITRIRDATGRLLSFAYEPSFNQITQVIDEPGNPPTTMRYDERGNVIEVTDPEGSSMTFTYNNFGQIRTTRTALGNVTTFEYDEQGRLTAIIEPEGNRTRLRYDEVGRLVAQIDARGQSTRFVYDVMNRIVATIDPRGRRTQVSYDRNRNVTTITDARGNATTYLYDDQERLKERRDPLGNSDILEYDQSGNLTRFTDRRGRVLDFAYDPLNFLIRTTRTEATDRSITEQTYDAVGRLTRINDSVSGGVEFSYNLLDRVTREVTPQGAISYQYDAVGRRIRMTIAGQPDVIYRYDRARRLRQVQQGSDTVTIDLDEDGKRSRLTLPNGVATEYRYDRASRLTSLTYKRRDGTTIDTINYSYDASQNRSNVNGTAPYGAPPDPLTTIEYNRANQLLRLGNKTFTYDRSGNLETQTDPSGTVRYQWDTRRRLTAIDGPDLQARFTYDALGRRVRKEINGQSTSYLYDGQNIIQEASGSRVVATYLRGLAIDETFSRVAETRKTHYLVDALNSTLFLTDDGGNKVQQYAYDPFGRLVQQIPGPPAIDQPFTYTGREWDGATGLYHYRARYYDPMPGRFLSEDPFPGTVDFPRTLNPYPYAFNNPTDFTDPQGEFPPLLLLAGVGAVTGAAINVGITAATLAIRGEPITWGRLGSAALSGAVSGAIGALGGPLSGTIASRVLGLGANGLVARGISAAISGAGGYLGGVIGGLVNPDDPCDTSPISNTLFGALGGLVPTPRAISTLGLALRPRGVPRHLHSLFGSPTGREILYGTGLSGALGSLPPILGLYSATPAE
jgi:RHS repeat-associated protein